MSEFGKWMALGGLALFAAGLAIWLGGKLGLGRLPGDFEFRRGPTTVYFPLATCVLVSLFLTLLFWLFRR